jgi:hypothetical protein
MATTSASFSHILIGSPPMSYTDTTAPSGTTSVSFRVSDVMDIPHECEVIQRMSEAYREAKGR